MTALWHFPVLIVGLIGSVYSIGLWDALRRDRGWSFGKAALASLAGFWLAGIPIDIATPDWGFWRGLVLIVVIFLLFGYGERKHFEETGKWVIRLPQKQKETADADSKEE